MEKFYSSRKLREDEDEKGVLSCWGRLKVMLPWTRRKGTTLTSSRQRQRHRSSFLGQVIASILTIKPKDPKPLGGFRYDPLSYAQNFDEGSLDEDSQDSLYRGFSFRYAAPKLRARDDK